MLPALLALLACAAPVTSAQVSKVSGRDVAPAISNASVTFNRDIAPILNRRCYPCHQPNGSAPFSLARYHDVAKRAGQIAQVTASRFMPPWKPTPGYGEFADDQSLTSAEIEMFQRWAAQGTVEGTQAARPPVPQPGKPWRLGTPDKIVTMSQPCQIAAEGLDITRCFVFPLNLPAGTWVRAAEFLPENRRVVRDAQIYLDNSQIARKLQQQSQTAGYISMGGPGFLPTNTVRDWSPGSLPDFFVPEIAAPVTHGTDLVLLIHFHPTGKPEIERSQVGLYLTKTPPKKTLEIVSLGTNRIFLHPGQKNYRVEDSFSIPVTVDLYGMLPHAHYLCTEIKCTATLPDGTQKPLLWIKDWDYDWQRAFRTLHPLRLPAGTMVTVQFSYDNSSDNPRNPNDPPKFAMWGAQTMDEMAGLWLQVVPLNRADSALLAQALTSKALSLATAGHMSGHARQANRFQVRPPQ